MLRKPRKRVLAAALAGVVVLGIGGVTLPAAFAEDTGSIAGHYIDAGNPVPFANVTVFDTFGWLGSAMTDSAGAFELPGLAAGSCKLQFFLNGYEQWSSQKATFQEADVIMVTAGQVTTVEEVVRPYGYISGNVSNTDGSPATNVQISAYSSNGSIAGNATSDSAGLYTPRYLSEGQYKVQFRRGWSSPVQWANNVTGFEQAALIGVTVCATTTLDQTFLPVGTITGTVTDNGAPASFVQLTFRRVTVQLNRNGLVQYIPGQLSEAQAQQCVIGEGTTVLNEQLLPTGTVTGRLTLPGGAGVAWASVNLNGTAGSVSAGTDFNGNYTVRAYPGDYTVAFQTPYGRQWEDGRSSAAAADPVTVVANSTITVDEVLAPFGTVTVDAVDGLTAPP
jgi:hypothetical protein